MSCVASAAASRVAPRVPAATARVVAIASRVVRDAPARARWPPPRRLPPWTSPRSRTRGSPGASIECAVGEGVAGLREGALARLAAARMPTQRVEDYRFTDPRARRRAARRRGPRRGGRRGRVRVDARGRATTRVVLVDGVFCAALSDLSASPAVVGAGAASAGAAPSDALGAGRRLRGAFVDLNAAVARRRDRHRAPPEWYEYAPAAQRGQ